MTGQRASLSPTRQRRANLPLCWFSRSLSLFGREYMNTNNHNGANQGSVTPNGLSPSEREEPTRAESLLAGENRLLEMLATGSTLSEILDALCRLIEDIASGSLCGIVLVDPVSNRLKHG